MKRSDTEHEESTLKVGEVKHSVSNIFGDAIPPTILNVYSQPIEALPIVLGPPPECKHESTYILDTIKKLNTLESLMSKGTKEPSTQPHKNIINLDSPPPGFNKQDDSFSHFLPFFKFSSSISKPPVCGASESVDTQDIDSKAIFPSSSNSVPLNQQK